MLTFLNSAILFSLAAVSIPILIHLFTRQKRKIVYFSSLRFLKELQSRQIRKLKIRQILLLLLRALIILAIVVAFARPTLKTSDPTSTGSGAQLTAVFILDNTLSMGRMSAGRTLLDRAKERTLKILGSLRQGDEIFLIYPQKNVAYAHDGARFSLSSIEEMVNQTTVSYASTDFVGALAAANQIMQESKNINKEVYLVSDMQKNGFAEFAQDEGVKLLNEDVKFFLVQVDKPDRENGAIASIAFDNQILEKDKVAEIAVQVANSSEYKLNNRLAHLFVNGKRVAQNMLNIESDAADKLLFRLTPDQVGFQSGYVLLEDDGLAQDNKRYFAYHIAQRIPILLVGDKMTDTQYLHLALQPQKEAASYIDLKAEISGNLSTLDLNQYRVVFLANVTRLNSSEVLKIQSFVKSGGGLFIFLGDNVDIRNYNENLHKKLQLPELTRTLDFTAGDQYLSLGEIDYSHPVFSGVFEKEKFVGSPYIRFAVDVKKDVDVDEIVKYSNQSPFLFESKLQKGRIFYVTTSLDLKWSDLIYKGFFVPLINRGAFYLAGAASAENEQISIGSVIAYESDKVEASAGFFMQKPNGERTQVKPDLARGRFTIRYADTDIPGVYELLNGDKVITQWACNFDATESRGEPIKLEDLKRGFADGQFHQLKTEGNIVEDLAQLRFGRELWRMFMLAALALLIAETVLSKAGLKK